MWHGWRCCCCTHNIYRERLLLNPLTATGVGWSSDAAAVVPAPHRQEKLCMTPGWFIYSVSTHAFFFALHFCWVLFTKSAALFFVRSQIQQKLCPPVTVASPSPSRQSVNLLCGRCERSHSGGSPLLTLTLCLITMHALITHTHTHIHYSLPTGYELFSSWISTWDQWWKMQWMPLPFFIYFLFPLLPFSSGFPAALWVLHIYGLNMK